MFQNHAVIIGASGLIGWGIVNELLSQDSIARGSFKRVTGVTNRRLNLNDVLWPDKFNSQPQLLLVDGVDLANEQEQITKSLRDKIPDADTITHVFYCVFRANNGDHEAEAAMNTGMMSRSINAIESLTSKLKFVVFPGGTRGYGIYRPGGIFTAPLQESLIDTLPDDYSKTVAYPSFRQLLTQASEGRSWTWCEICPDAVIGFAPNGSGWSLAAHWATYLSVWRLKYGEGSEVTFPGTLAGYDSKYTETSTRTLARFAVYASALRPEACGRGRTFNVADDERPGTMRERWPRIASWFGLKGVAPPSDGYRGNKPGEFIREHKELLESAGVKGVSVTHTDQLDSYGYWLTFDRHLSLRRLRQEAMFLEESRPEKGWWKAFEGFRQAGMIP